MVTDFYFADIQVGITLKVNERGALAGLTDNQLASLRQSIYTTLNCFIYTRALFLTDKIDERLTIKSLPKTPKPEQDGG